MFLNFNIRRYGSPECHNHFVPSYQERNWIISRPYSTSTFYLTIITKFIRSFSVCPNYTVHNFVVSRLYHNFNATSNTMRTVDILPYSDDTWKCVDVFLCLLSLLSKRASSDQRSTNKRTLQPVLKLFHSFVVTVRTCSILFHIHLLSIYVSLQTSSTTPRHTLICSQSLHKIWSFNLKLKNFDCQLDWKRTDGAHYAKKNFKAQHYTNGSREYTQIWKKCAELVCVSVNFRR